MRVSLVIQAYRSVKKYRGVLGKLANQEIYGIHFRKLFNRVKQLNRSVTAHLANEKCLTSGTNRVMCVRIIKYSFIRASSL